MPLIFKKKGALGETLGCWKIEEPEVFFLEKLDLAPTELAELSEIHGARRLEWLAGRLILHQISGKKRRLEISKTSTGKPFWPSDPAHFFSISHSVGKVAAAIISKKNCGLDIQIFTEKNPPDRPTFFRRKRTAGQRTD